MTPWFKQFADESRYFVLLAGAAMGLLIFLITGAHAAHAQASSPPTTTVCSSGAAQVSLTSSPAIYQDYHKAPELTDNYVQFLITNTSAYTIEAVQLGFTTTTPIQLALHEDGWYDMKLAPGKSGFVYFYVHTDEATPYLNGKMWVAPWTGDKAGTPAHGTGLPLCTHVQSVTVEDTSENSSNKVKTIRAADLGDGCFQLIVAGMTGNTRNRVNMLWSHTPATTEKWPADLLNLTGVHTVITYTTQPRVYTDTLFITDVPEADSTGWPYQTAYTFCMGQITGPIDPVIPNHPASFLNSSSDMTHNEIGEGEIDAKYSLLVARKDDGSVTAIAGDRVIYTITVQNVGTISGTNVILSDTVPAHTRFASNGSSSQWSPSCANGAPAGSVCSLTIPTVNAGQTLTYTFAVIVDQAAPPSITAVTNTVTGEPSTIIADDFTPVIRQARLGIAKTDGVGSVLPNDTVTYTIVVSNAGPSAVMGASINDDPPVNLLNPAWQSTAMNAASVPSSGSGDINATVTLSSGGRITYTLRGTVAPGAIGTLANIAQVMPPANLALIDSITEATDIDTVLLAADLSIDKTAVPSLVVAGNTLTYTLVVTNDGPSNIAGALLKDALPVRLTHALRTCVAGAGANCGNAGGSGSLSNVSVSLDAGSTLTITIVGTVDPAATGSIANTATITVPAGAVDTDGANNSSSVNTQVTQVTGLSIDKQGPATAVPGLQLTYTIVVTNNGPSVATNVTVSDALPAGLTFVSGADCSAPGTVLTCNAGTLGVGAHKTFSVLFNIAPAAKGDVTNTASVTSTQNTTGEDDTVVTTLTPLNDLDIVKVAPATAVAGTEMTYTLIVTNNGPSVATAVTVGDVVPNGLSLISASPACNAPNHVLTCNAGTLAVKGSKTFTATFAINAGAQGMLVNTAVVTSTETPTETTSIVTTTLTSLVDVDIVKLAPETAVAGTQLTYTLIVTNNGPSVANSVTVSDTLPNGLTLGSAPPQCDLTEGVLTCIAGKLPVNTGVRFDAIFTVSADVRGVITNTATVTSTETPTETATTVTTTVTAVTDLSIEKTGPATAIPGEQVTYQVVITNNGPSKATDVILTDPAPANLTVVGGGCVAGVCSVGSLNVGERYTLELEYAIDPFAIGSVTNTAGVTSIESPAAVTATVSSLLEPEVDLSISKTDGLDYAIFGTEVTYTILVRNDGPSGVVGATVSDTLPDEVTRWAWTCEAVSPDVCMPAAGNDVISPVLTLAPNSVVTITAVAQLATQAQNGQDQSLINTASVEVPPAVMDDETDNNTSVDETYLLYQVDVSVTKTVMPGAVIAPGQWFTYVVGVFNAGPSYASYVHVDDVLPVEMITPTWTCQSSMGATCQDLSGSGSLDQYITLDRDAWVTYTFAGEMDHNAGGEVVNTAGVDAGSEMVRELDPTNDTAAVTVTVMPNAAVSISKTDGQSIAVPGTTITYQITLRNDGPSNVQDSELLDIIPPALSGLKVSWQGSNGAGVKGDPSALVTASSVKVSLPEQSTLTFTVSGEVSLTATGWLTNVAAFVMEDGIAANNPITQAVDVDEVVPAVEMGMVFHDVNGNGVMDAGDEPMPGFKVMLTCSGHAGVELTTDADGEFSLVVPPGLCDMDVVALSVPAGYRLTTNNDHQSNVAHEGMNVMPAVGYQGLGTMSGVTFNDINANRERDAGESALPNVVVTLVSSTAQPSSLQAAITTTSDANGNYAFANVAEGGYTLNAQAPDGFVNTTVLPQNVTVQVNVNTVVELGFQNPGVLLITKAAQTGALNDLLGSDRLITYTLIVTNTGGGVLNNVLVTDTLQSYLQYVAGSATPAPVTTAPLVWQLGSLQPGASVKLQFAVSVAAGYTGASSNVALADSDETPPATSNVIVIYPTPTAISIVRFTAQRGTDGVTVAWATGFERDTAGFNLLRSATGNHADATQVNAGLIPAGVKGGEYSFVDSSAAAGVAYTYWLQEMELGGAVNDYAETAVVQGTAGQSAPGYRVFVPVLMR